ELLADDLALALRVLDAREAREEALLGAHVDEPGAEAVPEGLHHLVRLVLSQQPVIDQDAGELVADRAVDEGRRRSRIDAAGEPADHAPVPHLLADSLDLLVNHR